VSRFGFHDCKRSARSERELDDAALLALIDQIFAQSRQSYGSPRLHAELRLRHRVRVGRTRVGRLMRRGRLVAVSTRRRRGCSRPDPLAPPAPDLVQCDFHTSAPDGSGSPTSARSPAGRASPTWRWSPASRPAWAASATRSTSEDLSGKQGRLTSPSGAGLSHIPAWVEIRRRPARPLGALAGRRRRPRRAVPNERERSEREVALLQEHSSRLDEQPGRKAHRRGVVGIDAVEAAGISRPTRSSG
jgi:transposase InsO family protein